MRYKLSNITIEEFRSMWKAIRDSKEFSWKAAVEYSLRRDTISRINLGYNRPTEHTVQCMREYAASLGIDLGSEKQKRVKASQKEEKQEEGTTSIAPRMISYGIFAELSGTEYKEEDARLFIHHFSNDEIKRRVNKDRDVLHIDSAVAVFLATEMLHLDPVKTSRIVEEIERRNSEVPDLKNALKEAEEEITRLKKALDMEKEKNEALAKQAAELKDASSNGEIYKDAIEKIRSMVCELPQAQKDTVPSSTMPSVYENNAWYDVQVRKLNHVAEQHHMLTDDLLRIVAKNLNTDFGIDRKCIIDTYSRAYHVDGRNVKMDRFRMLSLVPEFREPFEKSVEKVISLQQKPA